MKLTSAALIPNSPTIEVQVDNGNAVASVVTLNQDATVGDITLDAADTLSINATRTLTLAGFGASVLSGAVSNAGAITVQGGAAHFISGVDGSGKVTVATGAILTAGHIRQGLLTIAGNASIDMNGGNTGTSKLGALSITGSGKLDLTNNKLIVAGGTLGAWNGSNYDGVTGLLKSGRNGGAWNGGGIVTSMTAAASANALTTLAVATAGELGKTTFGGVTVSPSDVVVMYTYAGDANLDGRIDADDYFQIDSHTNASANGAKSYFNGDFNYDGKIDGDDYFLIDAGYQGQGKLSKRVAIGDLGVKAVPEPHAFAVAAALARLVGLGARRRYSTTVEALS